MRIDRFTRSLWFAAVCAATLPFVRILFAPTLGAQGAWEVSLSISLVVYVGMVAPTGYRALRNATIALLGCGAVAIGSTTTLAFAFGLAVVLAIARSGFDFKVRPSRAIGIEALLGFSGVVFGAWIAWPGVLGDAVALWGFGLVQSVYFLLPIQSGRRYATTEFGDPFDRACERLLILLEEREAY